MKENKQWKILKRDYSLIIQSKWNDFKKILKKK